ncbi:hypothetical protein BH11BAC2_BH11BAC2_14780 [soil metagenome]
MGKRIGEIGDSLIMLKPLRKTGKIILLEFGLKIALRSFTG